MGTIWEATNRTHGGVYFHSEVGLKVAPDEATIFLQWVLVGWVAPKRGVPRENVRPVGLGNLWCDILLSELVNGLLELQNAMMRNSQHQII